MTAKDEKKTETTAKGGSGTKSTKSTKGKRTKKKVDKPVHQANAEVNPRFIKSDEELTEIREKYKALGRRPNPYKRGAGNYHSLVEALIQLGTDKYHSFVDVRNKVEEVMSDVVDEKTGQTQWEKFVGRKPRENANKPLDTDGRLQQNMKVLQRVAIGKDKHPYGEPLRQLGMCIDIRWRLPEGIEDPELAVPHFRLRTNYDGAEKPIHDNPFVKRGRKKKVQTAEKTEKLTAEKAEKPKTKKRKTKKPADEKPEVTDEVTEETVQEEQPEAEQETDEKEVSAEANGDESPDNEESETFTFDDEETPMMGQ